MNRLTFMKLEDTCGEILYLLNKHISSVKLSNVIPRYAFGNNVDNMHVHNNGHSEDWVLLIRSIFLNL